MWESIVDRLEANENDIVRIAVTGVAGDATNIVVVSIKRRPIIVAQESIVVMPVYNLSTNVTLRIRSVIHISVIAHRYVF